jgi:hypothetical protein
MMDRYLIYNFYFCSQSRIQELVGQVDGHQSRIQELVGQVTNYC